jgi:hypothetical protein
VAEGLGAVASHFSKSAGTFSALQQVGWHLLSVAFPWLNRRWLDSDHVFEYSR